MFVVDGVHCNSMEGFLQSLKYPSIIDQMKMCQTIGYHAKILGRNKKWSEHQTLFWQGVDIKRDSEQYQVLLNNAYNALYTQSKLFREVLDKTTGKLSHNIGNNIQEKTILTNIEFCGRLEKLRDEGILTPYILEPSTFNFFGS